MVQDEVNTMPTVKDTHSKKRRTFYEEKINTVMPATSAAVKKTWKRQSNCWSRWHHSRISKSEPVIRICPRLSDRKGMGKITKQTRAETRCVEISPVSTHLFFAFALSPFGRPHNLGAWDRLFDHKIVQSLITLCIHFHMCIKRGWWSSMVVDSYRAKSEINVL